MRLNTEGALTEFEPGFLCLIYGNQDLEKSTSMSSRLKGAGGIGDGDTEEKDNARADRPYPPGLQPGGKSSILFLLALYLPMNYALKCVSSMQLIPTSEFQTGFYFAFKCFCDYA